MSELKRIADEAWKIVTDARASRMEKLEGLKLIAATKGVLLPDIDERWLTVRQVCQLRMAKKTLLEKALRRKMQKTKANRKQYLKRRINELEGQKMGNTTE
jgi:hypothetical protein